MTKEEMQKRFEGLYKNHDKSEVGMLDKNADGTYNQGQTQKLFDAYQAGYVRGIEGKPLDSTLTESSGTHIFRSYGHSDGAKNRAFSDEEDAAQQGSSMMQGMVLVWSLTLSGIIPSLFLITKTYDLGNIIALSLLCLLWLFFVVVALWNAPNKLLKLIACAACSGMSYILIK